MQTILNLFDHIAYNMEIMWQRIWWNSWGGKLKWVQSLQMGKVLFMVITVYNLVFYFPWESQCIYFCYNPYRASTHGAHSWGLPNKQSSNQKPVQNSSNTLFVVLKDVEEIHIDSPLEYLLKSSLLSHPFLHNPQLL